MKSSKDLEVYIVRFIMDSRSQKYVKQQDMYTLVSDNVDLKIVEHVLKIMLGIKPMIRRNSKERVSFDLRRDNEL